jgi:hypothetical protein
MNKTKVMKDQVLSIWKSSTNRPKTEIGTPNEVCPCCGARVYVARTTAKEVAIATLCLLLLLAIAIPAAWATEQWMESEGQKIAHHIMIWQEPIDGWSR